MRYQTWVSGMIAGALAYAVVAVFFAVANMVVGQSPFHTALLLGRAIGAQGPGPEGVEGPILAANGLHVLLSLAVGVAASWLVEKLEHEHAIWFAVLLAFLLGFFLSIVAVGMLAAEIGGVATWPQVTVANALAAAVIGGYLGKVHGGLVSSIRQELEAD